MRSGCCHSEYANIPSSNGHCFPISLNSSFAQNPHSVHVIQMSAPLSTAFCGMRSKQIVQNRLSYGSHRGSLRSLSHKAFMLCSVALKLGWRKSYFFSEQQIAYTFNSRMERVLDVCPTAGTSTRFGNSCFSLVFSLFWLRGLWFPQPTADSPRHTLSRKRTPHLWNHSHFVIA